MTKNRYTMKELQHNGIYFSTYDYKGYSIKIGRRKIKLQPASEQMVVAYVKKENTEYFGDSTFFKNFMKDFLNQIKFENPSLGLILKKSWIKFDEISERDKNWICQGHPEEYLEIDFSEVYLAIRKEKTFKETLSKEKRKKGRMERKVKREALREKYGYAIVDGKRIEISNWTAEPSFLFMGRGEHPRRGGWKVGPTIEEVILNLSPKVPRPEGNYKEIIWEPTKLYIAKWKDKFSNKIKYVWFSDSAGFKQERERIKFKKADELGKKIEIIELFIREEMRSKNEERRKIATVCLLIFSLNMRVGDEKSEDEADTVGAITLRPDHIIINGPRITFNFLGKDSVRWKKELIVSRIFAKNLKEFFMNCKEYLFEGITSKKVTKFLSEEMEGLTAKVFRIWRCSKEVKEYLARSSVTKEDPEYRKKHIAKMANLEGAKVCNHKRKIPTKFTERMIKKKVKLTELEKRLKRIIKAGKKTDALLRRIEKKELDIELTKACMEYTLGTSLKSYINPNIYVDWAKKVNFNLEKFYSKALRKKYNWCIK